MVSTNLFARRIYLGCDCDGALYRDHLHENLFNCPSDYAFHFVVYQHRDYREPGTSRSTNQSINYKPCYHQPRGCLPNRVLRLLRRLSRRVLPDGTKLRHDFVPGDFLHNIHLEWGDNRGAGDHRLFPQHWEVCERLVQLC